MRLLSFVLVLIGLLSSSAAPAATRQADGRVTTLSPDWVPSGVVFVLSGWTGACENNAVYRGTNWLSYWSTSPETVKAVYSGLLSAYTSQKRVWLMLDDNSCEVSAIRFVP